AIHPESQGKLAWFHTWLPNVVTDFHEMGTNSTYFFEPMKDIGSMEPIMPKENYTTLNDLFAGYFEKAMNKIGSLYFTRERFDGTYPGYGSSYPDLHGGLALLFEQASSRGHIQKNDFGVLEFRFTIRNQLTNSIATLKAAVENKETLFKYQREFFASAYSNARKSDVKGYVFGHANDQHRNRAFKELLLRHKIRYYELKNKVTLNEKSFEPGKAWIVPTDQAQYRMVQTMFETYSEYRDSVFYDASSWSLVNAYGLPYASYSGKMELGAEGTSTSNQYNPSSLQKGEYGYLLDWSDYAAPKAIYALQKEGIIVMAAGKPFKINGKEYSYGDLFIPAGVQKISSQTLFEKLSALGKELSLDFVPVSTGLVESGVDLGSPNFEVLKEPKALMLIGGNISSYEAGEVWHLSDTKLQMPITKVDIDQFSRVKLHEYNTLILVSGSYSALEKDQAEKLKNWLQDGNTIITTRTASQWAIRSGLVKETLVEEKEDKQERTPYALAEEIQGADQVGGTIFEVELDITHPLAYGFHSPKLPIYRNSKIYLNPSKDPYQTVAKYTKEPHIDGFVSPKNLDLIKESAALIVSKVGSGQVIMFSDNPNFRGIWYGSSKLFMNAIFMGGLVR
ncbi:MAG: zinc carboxypeptidase, partial [Bacteroidetes bacterium]|nr:zinc carboxypeptidase [Bacteroidota bacterium]